MDIDIVLELFSPWRQALWIKPLYFTHSKCSSFVSRSVLVAHLKPTGIAASQRRERLFGSCACLLHVSWAAFIAHRKTTGIATSQRWKGSVGSCVSKFYTKLHSLNSELLIHRLSLLYISLANVRSVIAPWTDPPRKCSWQILDSCFDRMFESPALHAATCFALNAWKNGAVHRLSGLELLQTNFPVPCAALLCGSEIVQFLAFLNWLRWLLMYMNKFTHQNHSSSRWYVWRRDRWHVGWLQSWAIWVVWDVPSILVANFVYYYISLCYRSNDSDLLVGRYNYLTLYNAFFRVYKNSGFWNERKTESK